MWLHTALQKSPRLKKHKIFVAQLNAVAHHELAVLNTHSIQSTSGILTKTYALPTIIIPDTVDKLGYLVAMANINYKS